MNAQTLSRKLKEAGFTRTTWSPVKGRGRSRATSGFQVTASFENTIEVVVRDWNEERIEKIHSAVIGFGFQKVSDRGFGVRIYKATN
jgi:nitrogen regulatory protein PII